MVYNPATDFLGLWRASGGQVTKTEMPGLDYVVAALARAGLITLAVSATAPVVSQSTTAWLQANVPSYAAEGVMRLWDPVATAYVAATPALLFKMLETAAGENGVSWWTTTAGPPANIVGNNGDFAIRTDEPGGIYGPKAAGAWPAQPIAGTTDVVSSTQLDLTFGAVEGNIIYRDVALWQSLAIGGANSIMVSSGLVPQWEALTALIDAVFSNVRGSVLYRGGGAWVALGPGTANNVLTTNGPGADPSWTGKSSEFASGTVLLFYQAAAPTGWTKQVAVNDYGLRVTSGTGGGVTPGTAFSTVFAQTAVGGHTDVISEMPPHGHSLQVGVLAPAFASGGFNALGNNVGSSTGSMGGGGSHSHSVQLALSYVDIIIASKN